MTNTMAWPHGRSPLPGHDESKIRPPGDVRHRHIPLVLMLPGGLQPLASVWRLPEAQFLGGYFPQMLVQHAMPFVALPLSRVSAIDAMVPVEGGWIDGALISADWSDLSAFVHINRMSSAILRASGVFPKIDILAGPAIFIPYSPAFDRDEFVAAWRMPFELEIDTSAARNERKA